MARVSAIDRVGRHVYTCTGVASVLAYRAHFGDRIGLLSKLQGSHDILVHSLGIAGLQRQGHSHHFFSECFPALGLADGGISE